MKKHILSLDNFLNENQSNVKASLVDKEIDRMLDAFIELLPSKFLKPVKDFKLVDRRILTLQLIKVSFWLYSDDTAKIDNHRKKAIREIIIDKNRDFSHIKTRDIDADFVQTYLRSIEYGIIKRFTSV
jgi:hypothetical protein